MSCQKTFATLRIFSKDIHPNEMSEILGIESSESIPLDSNSKYRPRREYNLWLKTTDELIDSIDNLEHLNFIIALFKGKEENLAILRDKGCSTDIYCYWDSDGQGGPYLSCDVMANLVLLGLEISWQVYFVSDDEVTSITG